MKCFSGWVRKYLCYRYCEKMFSFRVSPYKKHFLSFRHRYSGRNFENTLGGGASTTIKGFSSKDTNNEKEAKEDALKDTIKNYYQLRQQLQMLKSQVVDIIGACRQLKSATLPNLKSSLKGEENKRESLAEGRRWAESAASDLGRPEFVNYKQNQRGLEKLKSLTPLKEISSRSERDRPFSRDHDRPKEGEEPGESKIGVDSDRQEPIDIDPYISSEILQQEKIDQLFAPNDRERDNADFDFKTLDGPPKEPRDPHVELYEKYSSERDKIQEKFPGKEDFDKKFDDFMKNNPRHRAHFEQNTENKYFIYNEPYSYYGTNSLEGADLISKHHQMDNELYFKLVQPIFDEDKYYQDKYNRPTNEDELLDPWKSVTETLKDNMKEVDISYMDQFDEKKDKEEEKKRKKRAVFDDDHSLAERYDLLRKQLSDKMDQEKSKSASEQSKDIKAFLASEASASEQQPTDLMGIAASETQQLTSQSSGEEGDLDHLKYEVVVERPSEGKISLGKSEALQSPTANDDKSFNDNEIKEALQFEKELNKHKMPTEAPPAVQQTINQNLEQTPRAVQQPRNQNLEQTPRAVQQPINQNLEQTPRAVQQPINENLEKAPKAAAKSVKVETFGPRDPRHQPSRPQIQALQKVPNNLFRHNTSYERQDETTVDENYVEEEKKKAFEEYLRNAESAKAASAQKEQIENERYIPDTNSGHSENNLWKDYYRPSKDK